MNTTSNNESWIEQKVILKQKINALTGNNLMFEQNTKDVFFEKLQIKLGKTKEEVTRILDSI